MIFLRELNLLQTNRVIHPLNLPVFKQFKSLLFEKQLTFFVGENGTGKSTLLEAIAIISQLPTLGSQEADTDNSLNHLAPLTNNLKLSWELKTKSGFFFRTEDVLGFIKKINQTKEELTSITKEFNDMSDYGLKLATGAVLGQKRALDEQYKGNPDAYSHGEAFLNLFQSRVNKPGLYLIDEPEAALSFKSQLALMNLIKTAIESGSQFIVATHSPILTRYPNSTLFNFNTSPPTSIKYEQIENFSLLTDFLNAPQAFLRHIV